MTAADRVIRWTTAGAVVGVAAVAATASYEHAYALVRAHGEAGWTDRLGAPTGDGGLPASSVGTLEPGRRRASVPPLARWLLILGSRRRSRPTWRHRPRFKLAPAATARWS